MPGTHRIMKIILEDGLSKIEWTVPTETIVILRKNSTPAVKKSAANTGVAKKNAVTLEVEVENKDAKDEKDEKSQTQRYFLCRINDTEQDISPSFFQPQTVLDNFYQLSSYSHQYHLNPTIQENLILKVLRQPPFFEQADTIIKEIEQYQKKIQECETYMNWICCISGTAACAGGWTAFSCAWPYIAKSSFDINCLYLLGCFPGVSSGYYCIFEPCRDSRLDYNKNGDSDDDSAADDYTECWYPASHITKKEKELREVIESASKIVEDVLPSTVPAKKVLPDKYMTKADEEDSSPANLIAASSASSSSASSSSPLPSAALPASAAATPPTPSASMMTSFSPIFSTTAPVSSAAASPPSSPTPPSVPTPNPEGRTCETGCRIM